MKDTSDYSNMSWVAMPFSTCSESTGIVSDQGIAEQRSQSTEKEHDSSTSPDLLPLTPGFSSVSNNFVNIPANNLYSPFMSSFQTSNPMLNSHFYYNFSSQMPQLSYHVPYHFPYQAAYHYQMSNYQPVRAHNVPESFESKPSNFEFPRPKAKRRTHVEPRNHVCNLCQKRFTRPSSLKTHRLTHTGEKPFPCLTPSCGKSFSVLSNLRRHYRVHAKRERKLAAKNQHRLLATPAGALLTFIQ